MRYRALGSLERLENEIILGWPQTGHVRAKRRSPGLDVVDRIDEIFTSRSSAIPSFEALVKP
jgi:hypothetical protein